MALSCIVCESPLKNVFEEDIFPKHNQPLRGLIFQTTGHYGSDVFDPMPISRHAAEYLEINVCDECIASKAKKKLVMHIRTESVLPRRSYEMWFPDNPT